MSLPIHVDALLAETRWLGGLARQLVGNEADASDLVQDTLHTALASDRVSPGPLRGWLRTILRSRWRDRFRQERARSRREASVAGATTLAMDPADVVQKAEAHRLLVEAVLDLDEPHRTCVLLRFFENLPPRAIAARTGAPIATVHSRLQRALARLRERLGERRGERWRAVLLPLLPRPTTPALLLGVSLMNVTTKCLLGAAAIAVAILAWPQGGEPAPSLPSPGVPAQGPAAAASANPPPNASPTTPSERTVATPPTSPDPRPETALPTLRGRVIDARGEGLAGVLLAGTLKGERTMPPTPSLADGSFELPITHAFADRIVAVDARWATVLAGVPGGAPDHCTVVCAPRVDLGGHVVDEAGKPLRGAMLAVHAPSHFGAGLGVLLDHSIEQSWQATSDAEGTFRLLDAPAGIEATLTVTLGGYAPHIAPLPPTSTDLLHIVLEAPGESGTVVDGIVVDAFGAAVQDACVSAGAEIAHTDTRGAFRLDAAGDRHLSRLVAAARGHQPTMFVPERDAAGNPRWPARVVMQLPGAPRTIAGRVRHADGRSAKGARVWIGDPLVVGQGPDTTLAENLAAGREAFWSWVPTNEDGDFQLSGLADRAYEVRAIDARTLTTTTLVGVAAGRTDVELVLPDELLPRLRGRVLARDGTPIVGVDVQLQRPALEVVVPGGTRDEWHHGEPRRTAADGSFEFLSVPRTGIEVFANGPSILFRGRMLTANDDAEDFVLTVDRRMHLQVELTPPFTKATSMHVLDDAGRPMPLRVMRGNAAHTSTSATFVDGRTEILSLGETARTVVFRCGDQEVARMPIQFAADGVTRMLY